MDTSRCRRPLNLLCRYVLGEGPQPGGLLAAGAQPGRRGLVAVGEVLPGHSGHRRVRRHVARRRGRLDGMEGPGFFVIPSSDRTDKWNGTERRIYVTGAEERTIRHTGGDY
jgi:hypothetical protein